MNIFVDTSAFLAVLGESDKNHKAAKPFWERIVSEGDVLLCHNYILVERWLLFCAALGCGLLAFSNRSFLPYLLSLMKT